jgi:hypothetical protein
MAVRGASAVWRHNVVASLTGGEDNAAGCTVQNLKSPSQASFVYPVESSAGFSGELSRIGNQCLTPVRIFASPGGERLEKPVKLGSKAGRV